MKWLRERVIEPEILDTLPPDAARASLRDLIRLNESFGGLSALRHALMAAEVPRTGPVSLVDVGAASGDMGREVLRWNPDASVMSTDRLLSHLAPARPPRACADAFALPFRDGAFDYAYSSLFLHHFTNEQVVTLLVEMRRVARRAVMAVDLHRHPIAYYFVPATRFVLRWDPVTVHDAPASVAAAFRPPELAALAEQAGLFPVRAQSHGLSFRISLVGACSRQESNR